MLAIPSELALVGPSDYWSSWARDPSVLPWLFLAALLYGRGTVILWRRAGVGRGVSRGQVAYFAGGLFALVIALVSPVDTLADTLVSVHMVQHLLLIVVAAPLLALSRPLTSFLCALPLQWRRDIARWWNRARGVRAAWRVLSLPLLVLGLHTLVLWSWHLPALYDAAVQNDSIHALEHLSFLLTALLLWWTLIHAGDRGALGYGAGILFTFATGMQSVALGVLFTFSRTPWYPVYAGRTAMWHLTPLQDQELAGVIMWVPAGIIYIAAACVLFVAWMQSMERHMRSKEHGRHPPPPGNRAIWEEAGGPALARRPEGEVS